MSKRCSASTCFNCQMTNKSVQYFCYPKHTEFARQWAERAQRPDLVDKPLINIVKYYLCSGHFSDSCFADPPHNTKLKRSVRPFSVPMPTIFAAEADFTGLQQQQQPPAHAIVGGDDVRKPLRQQQQQQSQTVALSFQEQRDAVGVDDDEDAATVYLLPLDDGEELIADESEYCIDSDTNNDLSVEYLELPAESLDQPIVEEAAAARDWTCRLCATIFPATESVIPIFSNASSHSSRVAEDIEVILPNMIFKHDGRPQQICEPCCRKTQHTASIVREFRAVQEQLFPSS